MINPNEIIFAVDEHDNPTEPLTRARAHKEGIWHRTSHIWVHDGQGQLLCQQRSLKKENHPGQWEAYFGGHMPPGIEPLEGAMAELQEEIGLVPAPKELTFWGVERFVEHFPGKVNNEFAYVYVLRWEGGTAELTLEEEEISRVRWVKVEEVRRGMMDSSSAWTKTPYTEKLISKLNNA